MPSKSDLKELRKLVELFVHAFGSDSAIPDDCFELDEDSSRIAGDILQLVSAEAGLDSPEELFWFMGEHVEDLAEPTAGELDKVVQALLLPARTYRFSLRLGPGRETAFAYWIGGPHELEVAFDSSEPPEVWLLGKVKSGTHPGAVLQVERVLDAYLGTCDVLGLSRYLPRRDEPCPAPRFSLGEEGPLGIGLMEATYAERLHRTFPMIPGDLTDLEQVRLGKDEGGRAVRRHIDLVCRVMAGRTADAELVRGACRHAMNAVASIDHGVAITLAFSAMEGLLLSPTSKSDTLAGLREAIAHTFGTSFEDRARIRKLVNELYEVRSAFVHTGQSKARYRVRQEVMELMRGVIKAQVQRLPPVAVDPRPQLSPGEAAGKAPPSGE